MSETPNIDRRMIIEPEAIYDDNGVYAILAISSETLSQARSAGELRFVRKGKRILYFGEWIISWLKADSTAKR